MAEVFTISGAALGQSPCPAGWQATPNGNCGAPSAGCPASMRLGAACRDQRAIGLQAAIRALGLAVRDPALSTIQVDGFVGPQTTQAVMRALSQHLGAGQVVLTQSRVAEDVANLTKAITTEVTKRGGKVDAVSAKTAARAPAVATVAPEGASNFRHPATWALLGLSALTAAAGFAMEWVD